MTRQEDLAWCAGFFDGEGCIQVTQRKKTGLFDFRVSLSQVSKWPLIRTQRILGGTIYYYPPTYSHRLEWNARQQAIQTLQLILPFLFNKQREARLFIAAAQASLIRRPAYREYLARINYLLKKQKKVIYRRRTRRPNPEPLPLIP